MHLGSEGNHSGFRKCRTPHRQDGYAGIVSGMENFLLFDRNELNRLLGLQEMSYNLLRWVGDSLESGQLSFSRTHSSLGSAEAAEEWIARHYAILPKELKPPRSDLTSFAHVFASYLTTSFRLCPVAAPPKLAPGQCLCDYCWFLRDARHLVLRNPTNKDREVADGLKLRCLRAIAEQLGESLTLEQEKNLLGQPEFSLELAHVSYAFELRRRCEFSSQGPGVLWLWRAIAWHEGKPRRDFKLTADRILAAQAAVESALLKEARRRG
jgi:hypothetical protein